MGKTKGAWRGSSNKAILKFIKVLVDTAGNPIRHFQTSASKWGSNRKMKIDVWTQGGQDGGKYKLARRPWIGKEIRKGGSSRDHKKNKPKLSPTRVLAPRMFLFREVCYCYFCLLVISVFQLFTEWRQKKTKTPRQEQLCKKKPSCLDFPNGMLLQPKYTKFSLHIT